MVPARIRSACHFYSNSLQSQTQPGQNKAPGGLFCRGCHHGNHVQMQTAANLKPFRHLSLRFRSSGPGRRSTLGALLRRHLRKLKVKLSFPWKGPREHVGGVIGAPRLELFRRPDHRFNFVVKAIKTVAALNYEVLANVTQNNISIVWKCQRKAGVGGQPARREAALAAAAAVGRTRGLKT